MDPPAGEAEEELGPPVEPRGLHRGPDGRAAGGSCSLGQDEGEKGSVEIDLFCFFLCAEKQQLTKSCAQTKMSIIPKVKRKKKKKSVSQLLVLRSNSQRVSAHCVFASQCEFFFSVLHYSGCKAGSSCRKHVMVGARVEFKVA